MAGKAADQGMSNPHEPDTVLLSTLPPNAEVKLVRINAGRGLVARLAAMGLVPGVMLRVLNNAGQGPFVLAVRSSRIMLGRGVAHRVVVAPMSGK